MPCDDAIADYMAAGFNTFITVATPGPNSLGGTILIDFGDGRGPVNGFCAGTVGGGINPITWQGEVFGATLGPGEHDLSFTGGSVDCDLAVTVSASGAQLDYGPTAGGDCVAPAGSMSPSASVTSPTTVAAQDPTSSAPGSDCQVLLDAVEAGDTNVGADEVSGCTPAELDALTAMLPEDSPIRQQRERGVPWWMILLAIGLVAIALVFRALAPDPSDPLTWLPGGKLTKVKKATKGFKFPPGKKPVPYSGKAANTARAKADPSLKRREYDYTSPGGTDDDARDLFKSLTHEDPSNLPTDPRLGGVKVDTPDGRTVTYRPADAHPEGHAKVEIDYQRTKQSTGKRNHVKITFPGMP
ncbi:MAG: hypothetical protein ACT4OV_01360 [Microthrixaceae bacterium]